MAGNVQPKFWEWRLITSFLLAPIFGLVAAILTYLVIGIASTMMASADVAPLVPIGFIVGLFASPQILIFIPILGYVLLALAILPLHYVLRRMKILTWTAYALVGAIVGAIAFQLITNIGFSGDEFVKLTSNAATIFFALLIGCISAMFGFMINDRHQRRIRLEARGKSK